MNLNRPPILTALAIIILSLTIHASAEWNEQVLYSFQGNPNDGYWPTGRVVFDKAGNLYGATTGWGPGNCFPIANECGLVYELSPPAQKGDPWTETILYEFQGKESNDGSVPYSGLLIDSHGNLYGATAWGGTGDCRLLGVAGGCGTVYELSPPAKKGDPWMETILYSFANTTDGYFPWGDLTFDAKGNLYVATRFGGGKGTNCDPEFNQYCGAVFELSPPRQKGGAWTEKLLHAFAGVTNGQQPGDGAAPNGGLVLDTQGAIYGTTYYGGNNQKGTCEGGSWGTGCGIVFKLVPPKKKGGIWTEKMLHLFDGTDGDLPTAGVIVDGKGNLYGTTYGGPIHGHGLVFELEKPSGKRLSWKETVIYAFKDGNDGGYPDAGLLFDASGHLYGTASAAGAGRGGTVFRITPLRNGNWDFIVLHDFTGNPDGAYPDATLVFDKAGNLYGTTLWAGSGGQACGNYGCGTVFEVSP